MAKDELRRNAKEADQITKESKARSAKGRKKYMKLKERMKSQKKYNAKGVDRIIRRKTADPLVARERYVNDRIQSVASGKRQIIRKSDVRAKRALKDSLRKKYQGKAPSKMKRSGLKSRLLKKYGRKLGRVGSASLRGMGNLLGATIAVEAGTQAIKNVSAIAKKKQTTSQRKAIGQQDKRMMKKYKKKDPKRQAVFKKLMSKKTKIKEY